MTLTAEYGSNGSIGVGLYEEHNAGIAAVRNGKVLLYCEFERITRVKNQAGWFPKLTAKLLEQLPIDEVDTISAPRPAVVAQLLAEYFDGTIESESSVVIKDRRINICHQNHLHPIFHILSTLVLRDVRPGVYAVLVFDAEQPRIGWIDIRNPLSICPNVHLRPISHDRWFNGSLFADFFGAMFYGSCNLSNCGKLMGLASWGKTRISNVMLLEEMATRYFNPDLLTWQGYSQISKNKIIQEITNILQVYPLDHDRSEVLDLAAAAQELFSHELVTQVRRGMDLIHNEILQQNLPAPIALLYGGGCALSVVSNARLREALDIPIIIPPYAHDASQCLGAAIWASLQSGHNTLPIGQWSGLPHHTVGSVSANELINMGLQAKPADPDEVAQRIASGQMIGLVEKGSESGPRALGMRSLLANALDPHMRDRINSEVKKREWYRPFAPALPTESFKKYFNESATIPSAYMLDAFRVVPNYRSILTSVISPDGTSRPQAVSADVSPMYYKILQAVEKHLGHPIVLNTSLNAPGLPIAFDIAQVLQDCHVLTVDAAIIDKMLIEKEQISAIVQSGNLKSEFIEFL